MEEDRPSLPGNVHVCVLSHGHWSRAAWTEGLCSVLLCLSFPRESGFRRAGPGSSSHSLAKAQPWITSARNAVRLPCHPRTGADPGPGCGGATLHAASCRLLPSAARGRRVSRLLTQHEPPATPAPAVGPLAGVRPAEAAPQPHGFHPRVPPTAGDFLPASCGDPPGFPALLHASGIFVGPTETPRQGGGCGVGWV